MSLGERAEAADAPSANPYSGDFWTRSTLSGDWGGVRNDLAAKGVTLDMSLTQAAQGIVRGGKDTGWQFGGGRGDITLNVDSQKLGLWPGGFLRSKPKAILFRRIIFSNRSTAKPARS
jgi:porin